MTLQYACADVDSLAGALALGAVDADELHAAREHLAGCPEPHTELRSLLGAEAALAAGLEPIQPSAGLRDRLMGSRLGRRQGVALFEELLLPDLPELTHPACTPGLA